MDDQNDVSGRDHIAADVGEGAKNVVTGSNIKQTIFEQVTVNLQRLGDTSVIIWAAVIAAAAIILAAVIGIFPFLIDKISTPAPPTPTVASFAPAVLPATPTAGDTPADPVSLPNMEVVFTQKFLPGFWSIGEHKYMLELNCADGTKNVTRTHSFTVSEDAPSRMIVQFRLSGMRDHSSDTQIYELHPGDLTEAEITFTNLTIAEAIKKKIMCKPLFGWDDKPPQELTPMSYQTFVAPVAEPNQIYVFEVPENDSPSFPSPLVTPE